MEETPELITFVDVNESESKIKSEDMELSTLEENINLKNFAIYPSESNINERLEQNFRTVNVPRFDRLGFG